MLRVTTNDFIVQPTRLVSLLHQAQTSNASTENDNVNLCVCFSIPYSDEVAASSNTWTSKPWVAFLCHLYGLKNETSMNWANKSTSVYKGNNPRTWPYYKHRLKSWYDNSYNACLYSICKRHMKMSQMLNGLTHITSKADLERVNNFWAPKMKWLMMQRMHLDFE